MLQGHFEHLLSTFTAMQGPRAAAKPKASHRTRATFPQNCPAPCVHRCTAVDAATDARTCARARNFAPQCVCSLHLTNQSKPQVAMHALPVCKCAGQERIARGALFMLFMQAKWGRASAQASESDRFPIGSTLNSFVTHLSGACMTKQNVSNCHCVLILTVSKNAAF